MLLQFSTIIILFGLLGEYVSQYNTDKTEDSNDTTEHGEDTEGIKVEKVVVIISRSLL